MVSLTEVATGLPNSSIWAVRDQRAAGAWLGVTDSGQV